MRKAMMAFHAVKGRCTATRIPHRFEKGAREAWNDGCGARNARHGANP
jgi:hypothetical protein